MEFLKFMEGIRTPVGDAFFLFCTLGGEEMMLFGLISVIYWCVNKNLAYRMTFAYLPSGLAVNTLKITFRIPRPWVRDPSLTIVEKARKSATGYSFPSGHTQNATALFGTLSCVSAKKWQKLLFFLVIPLVMLSRTYLGVHTPADVLVSFAVSILITFGVNLLADKITMTQKKRLLIASVLMIVAIAITVYTVLLFSNGTISEEDAANSMKGYGAGVAFLVCWILETKYINFDVKCSKLWKQFLKFAIGIGGILALRAGIKALFGEATLHGMALMAVCCIRYFLIMLWAMLLMPLIIKKWFQVRS